MNATSQVPRWIRYVVMSQACVVLLGGLLGIPLYLFLDGFPWYWSAADVILALVGAYIAEQPSRKVFFLGTFIWCGVLEARFLAGHSAPNFLNAALTIAMPLVVASLAAVALAATVVLRLKQ